MVISAHVNNTLFKNNVKSMYNWWYITPGKIGKAKADPTSNFNIERPHN